MEPLRQGVDLIVDCDKLTDHSAQVLSRNELSLHPVGWSVTPVQSARAPTESDLERRLWPETVNNRIAVLESRPDTCEHFVGIRADVVWLGAEASFDQLQQLRDGFAGVQGLRPVINRPKQFEQPLLQQGPQHGHSPNDCVELPGNRSEELVWNSVPVRHLLIVPCPTSLSVGARLSKRVFPPRMSTQLGVAGGTGLILGRRRAVSVVSRSRDDASSSAPSGLSKYPFICVKQFMLPRWALHHAAQGRERFPDVDR